MVALNLDTANLVDLSETFPKACASALNKMASKAKTKGSSQVRERYNIKKKDLDANFRTIPATAAKLQSQVRASGARIPLYDFDPKPDQPEKARPAGGVSVMVVKGERKVLRGTFIARVGSGHIGIFERLGDQRLPIGSRDIGAIKPKPNQSELKGLSVPQMFGSQNVMEKLTDFVDENLRDLAIHEIEFFISKGWR